MTVRMLMLIDAFADAPFTGNPAAVCVPQRAVDAQWMQGLAAEMNQAETAFLWARSAGEWDLRWFTPVAEVDLCGHATLASAHALWETGMAPATQALRFHTRSGVLACTRRGSVIAMDFPAVPVRPATPPEDLDTALGARLLTVASAGSDLLVEVDDAATVRGLAPDLVAIAALDLRALIVTARSDDARWHFVSRVFAPRYGIPEDPVTGSAHCALGPFWGARLRRTELVGRQCSRRGGTVGVTLGDGRVELTGSARTVLRGELA
ncbi:MAG: PhzF family phenazine biosynthesis protein [Planctomycetes bacterium]|nr:PhzF family phenazine biosynthesis protein [Planctomycetota bacterium]